jgi:Golgi phosphoprotein 3 (GPP34)
VRVVTRSRPLSGPATLYGEMVILAEDVLLLLIDDTSGRAAVDRNHLDLALAGGVLLELATSGRVDVAGPGEQVKAGRLVVRDDRPTDDIVLDAALRRVAGLGPKKPEHVLPKLARGLRDELLERLTGREILRAQEGRVLGVFPRHTWPAIDPSHEREVRAGLRDVLVVGRTPTPREAALISLLEAINQVPKVLGEVGVPARALRRRAKEVAAGGFADEAVRRAVQALAAATSAAISSAASVGGVT